VLLMTSEFVIPMDAFLYSEIIEHPQNREENGPAFIICITHERSAAVIL